MFVRPESKIPWLKYHILSHITLYKQLQIELELWAALHDPLRKSGSRWQGSVPHLVQGIETVLLFPHKLYQ